MNKSMILFSLFVCLMSYSAIALDTLIDNEPLDYVSNQFLDDDNTKLGMLIPAILLVVTIIMFAVDFGAVGVAGSSVCALLLLYMLKIIYLNPVSLISFIIIVIIMIYKIQRG